MSKRKGRSRKWIQPDDNRLRRTSHWTRYLTVVSDGSGSFSIATGTLKMEVGRNPDDDSPQFQWQRVLGVRTNGIDVEDAKGLNSKRRWAAPLGAPVSKDGPIFYVMPPRTWPVVLGLIPPSKWKDVREWINLTGEAVHKSVFGKRSQQLDAQDIGWVQPEDVNAPSNRWRFLRTLVNDGPGSYSLVLGQMDGENVLAIRTNGRTNDPKGFPKPGGHPSFYVLPVKLWRAFLSLVPGPKDAALEFLEGGLRRVSNGGPAFVPFPDPLATAAVLSHVTHSLIATGEKRSRAQWLELEKEAFSSITSVEFPDAHKVLAGLVSRASGNEVYPLEVFRIVERNEGLQSRMLAARADSKQGDPVRSHSVSEGYTELQGLVEDIRGAIKRAYEKLSGGSDGASPVD